VLRETVGLGPLESLLDDPEVDEVLVNGVEEVWVERGGRLERADGSFESEAQLHDVVERILGPLGRRVDESSPFADGRLPDGSRVNVIIPPLAIGGVTISIRRFTGLRPGPEELVRRGSVPAELMDLLREEVAARRNILISGGTGSGKTTLLNALSSFIAGDERVITIEDAAELRLCQPHVVRLESRPPGIEGGGAVTIRDLVRNALRMRPDRLIIGEVRGAEAMDLIVALNTGHRGALSTVHANGPVDALRRLEMLASMAGLGIEADVIRSQLSGALDGIVQVERGEDGSRYAAGYSRVLGLGEVAPVWERL
jgi:pilus assembly protein CpaF